jgi:CheY-like chemotaxis protein
MMSPSRPRLVVPAGALPTEKEQVESLKSAFDVIEVGTLAEAQRLAATGAGGIALLAPEDGPGSIEGLAAGGVMTVLEFIGEGVGVINDAGELTWANTRLQTYGEETRRRFVDTCLDALEHFNQSGAGSVPLTERPGRKFTFDVEDAQYEVMVSIAAVEPSRERMVRTVVGVLWEVTSSRQLQSRLEAIDAAGAELLHIETSSITRLNMAERLKLLEEKIVRTVRELLNFDNFEIRLVDRETNRLELVTAVGISPLRIGERFYVDEDNSGISGYVAATGRSYLCSDTAADVRYHEGLEGARSSLTVPLWLHDRVVGVFNVESRTANAFDENDRRFAEIFGRYIAMAMHILDLLVVERYTTNEQLAENLLRELNDPLGEITSRTAALRAAAGDDQMRDGLDRILEAAGTLRHRLEACTAGPKSILGAEQELHKCEPDPVMIGKQVLVADNEGAIRDAIGQLLTEKGCQVTVCSGGAETIDILHNSADAGHTFDLVISDIRMPDRNGYEVFRAAKEIDYDTPVILITGFGYDPHHSIVRASQEGLHAFLFKPLKAVALLEAVSNAFVHPT